MTVLDDEFEYFLFNMSCLSVLKLPYKERCRMAKSVEDCHAIINYFNYFKMMYCFFQIEEKTTEVCVMFLFTICVLIYMIIMAIVVDTYFTPVLKILSVKMHMNEYLAGVTLLAFGNSSPDLIANLMPIRAESAMFTGTIGNAIAIVLLGGGMICYLKPFKMDGHSTVRDLLFLLLAVELLHFVMFSGDSVSTKESLILLSFYIIFLFINIVDLLLLRHTIKNLRLEIIALRRLPISPQTNKELKQKLRILRDLEQHEVMSINKHNANYFIHKSRGSSFDIFATTGAKTHPEKVDFEATRSKLHRKSNSKNRFLVQEFLESLNPIDAMDWKLSGCCRRILLIIKSPLVLLVTLFVPVVNYERYKHGWSKLLNCTQIVTNPFIIITAVHSKVASVYYSWYIDFNINYSKWSLCLTIPLAVIVFFHARTDLPPAYHILFIMLSASSSLVIIMLCAAEIEVLTSIVGIVFDLSENFISITFGSVTNAFIDLMSNFTMTMQGYEKMAFAAIFAGPFFSIVVGMGIALLFNEKVRLEGSSFWLYGEHGANCYIFMWITVLTTLLWCLTFNFFARRSAGIFSWIIFLLFILYAVTAEWDLVHEFTNDQMFNPR